LAGNQQQAAQNYFFRVAGMNRTLQQNVVFTGNFLANSGAPQTAQTSNSFGGVGGGGGAGGNQLQQAAANASQQSPLVNSRIVGTAVVASTNQIEINAVPVTK
jgi:predicted glycosyltransferase